jgi:CheY-like chemotaxis protein
MLYPQIFMIDDSQTICAKVIALLRSVHCLVEAYHNSDQGLRQISRSKPDCLLLDIVFPLEKDVNGFALCRKLSTHYQSQLPIIILSNKNTPLDVQYARRQGARGYIGKDECTQTKLITTLINVLPDTFSEWSTHARALASPQQSTASHRSIISSEPLIAEHFIVRRLLPFRSEWSLPSYVESKVIGTVYNALDDKKTVGALEQEVSLKKVSKQTFFRALDILFVHRAIALISPSGQAINLTTYAQLFEHHL